MSAIGGIKTNWSKARIQAIVLAIDEGERLRDACPTLAEEFRQGATLTELAKKYESLLPVRIGQETAKSIVANALRGYQGIFGLRSRSYDGQMSTAEYKEIMRRYRAEIGSACGKNLVQKRLGLHSWSPEQQRANAQKLCLGAKAFGAIPFGSEERTALMNMANDPHFRKKSGRKICAQTIAAALNNIFHNNRTPVSIAHFVSRERKFLARCAAHKKVSAA